MNRLLLIAMVFVLALSACTVNRGLPQDNNPQEPYTGLSTKVAILPLRTLDSRSGNIRKILTVRDLDIAFSKHPQYDLLDMASVERQYKTLGFRHADDLELDELKEASDITGSNVVITGNISSLRANTFAVSMKLYSARTGELRQVNFNLTNNKIQRWKVLEESLMADLDKFISTEVDKIFNIATNFYASGNYEAAEKQLQTTIGLNPDKKEAYYYLGATYYKTGKYAQAEQNLNKVLSFDPDHMQSLMMLNDLYEATANTAKRVLVMEKIATILKDEELWLAVANVYDSEKNVSKAEEALNNALKINPNYALAQTRMSFLLYDNSRFADAIPYLEATYDRFPDNDIVSRRLAIAYQKSGRMSEAIARYEALIKNNPQNTQAYLNVVGLYRNQASESNDPKIAAELNAKVIDAMNKLIKIDPNIPMAYVNLAGTYLTQGKNAEAETNANLAIQKDSGMYLPYIILATVSQSRGTTEYNRFVDLEKKASTAVGKQATQLSKDRDAAKNAANNHFRRAVTYLNEARNRTTEAEILSDINSRLTGVNTLVNQTSGY